MKQYLIVIINYYQRLISPDQGFFSRGRKYCTFEPTCSEYTKRAIEYGGVWYGVRRGVARLARCHPFQKNHFDPFRP